MKSEIVVALIAFAGTAIGAFGGIITANKLVNFRLEQLENKVNKHNNLIERTYKAEGKIAALEERLDSIERRIEDD